MGRADIPTETERKYLIKKPSASLLESLENCEITDISQTYLIIKQDGVRRRVRRRGNPEKGYKLYYTEKSDISFGVREEIEREISQAEYDALLEEADPARTPIEKQRCVINYRNQLFELDLYPFSDDLATLEIELENIDDTVILPDYLDVICDVTGDRRYNNSTLAGTHRLEIPE